MKAFLQHDVSGMFYRQGGWVSTVSEAHAFATVEDAEHFLQSEPVARAHIVRRLDPMLIQRFQARAPGQYQAGE